MVKDISVAELRANTIMLAKLATLMKLPASHNDCLGAKRTEWPAHARDS